MPSPAKGAGRLAIVAGAADLPASIGYALGYRIVSDYLQQTGATASALHNTPAAAILERTVDRRGIEPYVATPT